jgi:bacterioferritin
LRIGKDLKSRLENDLAIEMDAVARLNESIKTATELGDNGSRDLFERILIDEEHHIDWLEGQLGVIEEIGIGLYLSQQMGEEPEG